MTVNHDALQITMAGQAVENAEFALAWDFLRRVPPTLRPREVEDAIHAGMVRTALTQLDWKAAEDHLKDANALRTGSSRLFQKRLTLIRGRTPLLADKPWGKARIVVGETQRLYESDLKPQIDGVWACGAYVVIGATPWTRLLRHTKSPREEARELVDLTCAYFARFLAECTPLLGLVDLAVAIPADRDRYVQRGNFSLPDELASRVQSQLALPWIERALLKQKKVELKGMGAWGRYSRIQGAFGADQIGLIQGRSVLVVDDIVTTGATMREAGRVLREAGAQSVYGLALSHVESRYRNW